MMKKWKVEEAGDALVVERLRKEINVSEIVARLLIQRGVSTYEEAKQFFRPAFSDLHDPFLMKDMERAAARIKEALEKQEKILVYGDYDVDGTTAVALMSSFLSSLDLDVEIYIPDRYSEGYGISLQGIDFARANECHLMIALDCGIRAIDQIDYASSHGIDCIICDHHLPGDSLPKAQAILDPNRSDCTYPFKGLSGCGVGYKLAQAVCRVLDIDDSLLHRYLDLLTVSIGADIVPIQDENRVFAHFGLKKLKADPSPGVRALFASAEFQKQEVSISDVVFILAPRINAAGRMASGKKAVELMISTSEEDLINFAKSVEQDNSDRKEQDMRITQEALQMIQESPDNQNAWSTVLYDKNWHKGVVGIVASRLIEKYYRPTIIFAEQDGILTGSARSIHGFDLHQALEECNGKLIKYGGHAMAAGMSLRVEDFDEFKQEFDQVVRKHLQPDDLIPTQRIHSSLGLDQINDRMLSVLKQFGPFGPGNPKPVFQASNIVDAGGSRTIGKEHEHLKLWVRQEEPLSIAMGGVGFGLGEYYPEISSGKPFKMAYSIDENEWRGKVQTQLNIRDIILEK